MGQWINSLLKWQTICVERRCPGLKATFHWKKISFTRCPALFLYITLCIKTSICERFPQLLQRPECYTSVWAKVLYVSISNHWTIVPWRCTVGKQRSLRGEQMISKDCEINSYVPLSGLTPDKVTAALQTQSLSCFLQTARRLLKHS